MLSQQFLHKNNNMCVDLFFIVKFSIITAKIDTYFLKLTISENLTLPKKSTLYVWGWSVNHRFKVLADPSHV